MIVICAVINENRCDFDVLSNTNYTIIIILLFEAIQLPMELHIFRPFIIIHVLSWALKWGGGGGGGGKRISASIPEWNNDIL